MEKFIVFIGILLIIFGIINIVAHNIFKEICGVEGIGYPCAVIYTINTIQIIAGIALILTIFKNINLNVII